MEKEDNLTEGVLKTRPVLTDMTNLPPKRPFSLISGDDGVDNLIKKQCQLQFGPLNPTHHNDNKDNNNNVLLQPKEKNPCFKLPFCSDTSPHDVSYQEPNMRSGASEELEQNETSFGFGRPSNDEGLVDRAIETDERDLYVVDNLGPPECAAGVPVEPPTVPASGGSKFFGLERCAGLKGQGGANSAADLLKKCTCSFCTKAGYIWSDLYYQEAKARLSAARKSQKEASMVLKKFSGIKDTHTIIHNQQDCADPSNLESTLMHQWKSLFVYMESKYAQENSQLESDLQKLKDLREKCKNDLELTDNSNFDNHRE